MKSIVAVLLLLCSAALSAQQFQHIVIIVQENRTPDNLLTACAIPGADFQSTGVAESLVTSYDLGHARNAFLLDQKGKWDSRSYNYVQASDIPQYCQLATTYATADRMFQTNQGPSMPAHQFIISGTSALDDSTDVLAMNNPVGGDQGCLSAASVYVPTIDNEDQTGEAFPCFDRSSVLNLLDGAGLTWRYYTLKGQAFWDAPAALSQYYESTNVINKPSQILTDVSKCELQNVSWVTPTALNSDHPGGNDGGGPAWVASIVNAIGNQPQCSDGEIYWNNTAIVVTWDDWGGFYDHVTPPANTTGWAPYYAYGFRVPLLVVSSLTPAMVDHSQHDFGSILHFIENNWSLPFVGPGTWADSYADDLSTFFPGPQAPFIQINSRELTKAELEDRGAPDND